MAKLNTNHCYIGPNIPTLGLKRNTVYRTDAMPQSLVDLVKLKPVARALFVHTKDLPNALFKLDKHGSLEYTAKNDLMALARSLLQKPVTEDRGDFDRNI